MAVLVIVERGGLVGEGAGVSEGAEPGGEVLNWALLYGLSLDVFGCGWVRVTPSSVGSSATVREVVELLRSAWITRGAAGMLPVPVATVWSMGGSGSGC